MEQDQKRQRIQEMQKDSFPILMVMWMLTLKQEWEMVQIGQAFNSLYKQKYKSPFGHCANSRSL